MQPLYPLLNQADAVVFATPLYFYGMSAQIRTVIDRFYPLCKDDKKPAFEGKQSAMILCGAEEDDDAFAVSWSQPGYGKKVRRPMPPSGWSPRATSPEISESLFFPKVVCRLFSLPPQRAFWSKTIEGGSLRVGWCT